MQTSQSSPQGCPDNWRLRSHFLFTFRLCLPYVIPTIMLLFYDVNKLFRTLRWKFAAVHARYSSNILIDHQLVVKYPTNNTGAECQAAVAGDAVSRCLIAMAGNSLCVSFVRHLLSIASSERVSRKHGNQFDHGFHDSSRARRSDGEWSNRAPATACAVCNPCCSGDITHFECFRNACASPTSSLGRHAIENSKDLYVRYDTRHRCESKKFVHFLVHLLVSCVGYW